jgi:hypothetical protein
MNTAAVPAPRRAYLDNLKVLLVTGVIVGHVLITYADIGSWAYREPSGNKAFLIPAALFVVLGSLFAMGLFFLLAGLLLPRALARKGPAAPKAQAHLIFFRAPLAQQFRDGLIQLPEPRGRVSRAFQRVREGRPAKLIFGVHVNAIVKQESGDPHVATYVQRRMPILVTSIDSGAFLQQNRGDFR